MLQNKLAQTVPFLTYILKVQGLNPGWNTTDILTGFFVFSLFPGKCKEG
jgi:hypothetical protein